MILKINNSFYKSNPKWKAASKKDPGPIVMNFKLLSSLELLVVAFPFNPKAISIKKISLKYLCHPKPPPKIEYINLELAS